MKNCNEIMELMSSYIDNLLDENERAEFESHIAGCDKCKKELDDMTRIITLCNGMPEEELPVNFREELHQKLLSAKADEDRKSRLVPFFNRYVRIGSSIAAVILVAVLARGLWAGMNFTHSKANTDSQAKFDIASNGSAERKAQAQPSQETTAGSIPSDSAPAADSEAPTMAVQGSEDKNAAAKYGDAQDQKISLKSSKTDSGGMKLKSFAAEAASPDTKQEESQYDSIKPSRSNNGDIRFGTEEAAAVVNRNIELTYSVDKIPEAVDMVKSLASANGIEMRQDKETSVDAAAYGAGSEAVLTFKVKNEQYDAFMAAVKSGLDPAALNIGALNSVSMNETLATLNSQLNEVNNKINDIENKRVEADQETLDRMKAEENDIQLQIQNIHQDAGYTVVTVKIVGKQQ